MSPFTSTPRIHRKYHTVTFLFALAIIMTALAVTDGIAASTPNATPKYAISLSVDQAVNNAIGAPLLTANVTADGAAVADQKVIFTLKVKDDPKATLPETNSVTSANGRATFRLRNFGGSARTITVTAALESDPAATASTDVIFQLPEGFIALSENLMTSVGAEKFCKDHGGSLPRVNESASFPRSDVDQVKTLDGFSAPGAPWPSGLPYDRYWTSTNFTNEPAVTGVHGGVWLIGVDSGKVVMHNEGRSVTYRAICIQ